MRLKTSFLILVLAMISLSATNTRNRAYDREPNPDQSQAGKVIPGQFIVELKTRPIVVAVPGGKDRAANVQNTKEVRARITNIINDVLGSAKVAKDAVMHTYQDAIVGFTAKLTPAQVELLKKNPNVMGVYPDFMFQLAPEPLRKIPDNLVISQQTISCAVEKAGGPVDGSRKATWIWILDTGIDLDHPDLNVQTRPLFARSFIDGQTVEDGHGHGTHVAGIAAARNNRIGVVGVSAGATVVPVKVLANSKRGSWSSLIGGLNHVAMYKIPGDVVNMSLGAFPINDCAASNPALVNAIRNLDAGNVWLVMAAGNDSGNANLNAPGCINGKRVLTVGALNCDYSCAGYSNWGSAVDWAAIGTNVYSTHRDGGYVEKDGTSMATPVVAGIIHARNGIPLVAGTANCRGGRYPIARR